MIKIRSLEENLETNRRQAQTALLSSQSQSETTATRYQYVDAHMHYLGFIQQTQGFTALLDAMDDQNVHSSVLFCMPYNLEVTDRSIDSPDLNYYLTDDSKAFWHTESDMYMYWDWVNLISSQQSRFYPFMGGASTINENSADQMARVLDLYKNPQTNKSYFRGIGELMFRHDFLTWKSGTVTPRPDSKAAENIFQLAAARNLPVNIHHDLTSLRANGYPIYKNELNLALIRNPSTKIIWAHCGMTYYVMPTAGDPNKFYNVFPLQTLLDTLDTMLNDHPNLYLDLSWVVFDNYILGNETAWAALINKYPTRFMIGTDTVAKWNDGTTITYDIQKYSTLLDTLNNPVTAQRVASNNFLSLIGQPPL